MISTLEDVTTPIMYREASEGATEIMHDAAEKYNRYVLSQRESHGKRTKVRVAFEVWARNSKKLEYMRLRQRHVVLSLPSADQAELAIQLIEQVCRSLEGKHLVKPEK